MALGATRTNVNHNRLQSGFIGAGLTLARCTAFPTHFRLLPITASSGPSTIIFRFRNCGRLFMITATIAAAGTAGSAPPAIPVTAALRRIRSRQLDFQRSGVGCLHVLHPRIVGHSRFLLGGFIAAAPPPPPSPPTVILGSGTRIVAFARRRIRPGLLYNRFHHRICSSRRTGPGFIRHGGQRGFIVLATPGTLLTPGIAVTAAAAPLPLLLQFSTASGIGFLIIPYRLRIAGAAAFGAAAPASVALIAAVALATAPFSLGGTAFSASGFGLRFSFGSLAGRHRLTHGIDRFIHPCIQAEQAVQNTPDQAGILFHVQRFGFQFQRLILLDTCRRLARKIRGRLARNHIADNRCHRCDMDLLLLHLLLLRSGRIRNVLVAGAVTFHFIGAHPDDLEMRGIHMRIGNHGDLDIAPALDIGKHIPLLVQKVGRHRHRQLGDHPPGHLLHGLLLHQAQDRQGQ